MVSIFNPVSPSQTLNHLQCLSAHALDVGVATVGSIKGRDSCARAVAKNEPKIGIAALHCSVSEMDSCTG